MTFTSATLARTWARLAPLPGGRWLFSRLLGRVVPYTGSIGATVLDLRPGYARLSLRDRRAVRNHLHSVHAVALVNLGEVASGLAMTLTLPPEVRGIVTRLGIVYHKKARGPLIAESAVTPPTVTDGPLDYDVTATITDASGAVVATTTVTWRLARR